MAEIPIPVFVGFVVVALGSAALAFYVWLRQRAHERVTRQSLRVQGRRINRAFAKAAAVQILFRREKLAEEAIRIWGPSKGDAE